MPNTKSKKRTNDRQLPSCKFMLIEEDSRNSITVETNYNIKAALALGNSQIVYTQNTPSTHHSLYFMRSNVNVLEQLHKFTKHQLQNIR